MSRIISKEHGLTEDGIKSSLQDIEVEIEQRAVLVNSSSWDATAQNDLSLGPGWILNIQRNLAQAMLRRETTRDELKSLSHYWNETLEFSKVVAADPPGNEDKVNTLMAGFMMGALVHISLTRHECVTIPKTNGGIERGKALQANQLAWQETAMPIIISSSKQIRADGLPKYTVSGLATALLKEWGKRKPDLPTTLPPITTYIETLVKNGLIVVRRDGRSKNVGKLA